jgi:hypothetical protein
VEWQGKRLPCFGSLVGRCEQELQSKSLVLNGIHRREEMRTWLLQGGELKLRSQHKTRRKKLSVGREKSAYQ